MELEWTRLTYDAGPFVLQFALHCATRSGNPYRPSEKIEGYPREVRAVIIRSAGVELHKSHHI